MSVFFDFFNLIANGVLLLTRNRSAMTITVAAAFVIAGLSWYLCNNYVKLWNRRFRLTATHQALTIVASILTFFFVLGFGGLKYMNAVTTAIVSFWEAYEVKTDTQWSSATFKDAYYKIKGLNVENFTKHRAPEQGGNFIPTSKKASQEMLAKVYALAACDHFEKKHPFLSKIIWSNAAQSTDNVSNDVVNYFESNSGNTYSAEKAIDIAANTIKEQLTAQTPRTVTLSRIALVVFYLLVMAIPLGAIGYAAYKDIRIQK